MEVSTSVIKHVERTSAIVSDAEGTLWKGRWLQRLGYTYLGQDWKAHNYDRIAKVLIGAVGVKLLLRKSKVKDTAETDALKRFYRILVKNGIGTQGEMRLLAITYMTENRIEQVSNIINGVSKSKPKIIVTQGGSTGANAARAIFSFDAFISNRDIFDEMGRLKDIEIVMRNGEQKARAAWNYFTERGISLSDCTGIGDSSVDIPMLMECKLRIASPEAKPEVLAIPNIIILEDAKETI